MRLANAMFFLTSLLLVSSIPLNASTTLIGTYDVNYLYNAAGCYTAGDFSSTQGNPNFCPSGYPPGPIFINAPLGRYEIVDTSASHVAVWSGDKISGTRYEPGGGTVDFDLTHGQIVLYYWDWYVADNSPNDFTTLKLYSVDSVPEPSTFMLAAVALLGVGLLGRRSRAAVR